MSDNRQNIIDATERLLQTQGLARLTTRDIAREAKVTEGLIYHHFKDKVELVHEAVERRVAETKNLLQNLPLQVGTRTLDEVLEDVFYAVYRSYYEVVILICALFTDHQLRGRMMEIMAEKNIGPEKAIEGLKVFLAAEQRLGRLSGAVDAGVAARCLWMIALQSAMEDRLLGRNPSPAQIRRDIHAIVDTLMKGFAPQTGAGEQKKEIS